MIRPTLPHSDADLSLLNSPARLAALDELDVLDTSPEDSFDDAAHIASLICDTPVALVSLVASDRQWFKARVGFETCQTDLKSSVCAYALVEPTVLVIPDLTQDSRTAENPLVTGEPNIRFYAGAPLRMPNGQVVGSLCVIDIKPRPHGLTAGQLDSLQRLSRQVVWFLQERRLRALIVAREENIRQAFARQLALTDLGDKLRDLDTPASMTAAAAKLVGETFHASRAGYGDLDATGEFVDIVDDWTVDGSSVLVGRHRLSDYGDIASLIARGDPVVIDDVDTNPHIASRVQAFHDLNIRSLLNVPQERGRTIGVFYIHNAVARMWTPEEVGFARDIASRVQVGIARIRAEDHQRTLNNELSHRMKNVLAMVQAIATQTMRSAVDLESARAALDARLVTMGKAHDILLAGRVDATNLDAVVRSALVFGDLDRFHIAGPFIKVGSKAALSLALMFHELATNAAKYGALASCDGTVTVTWTIDTGLSSVGVLNTGASNVGASDVSASEPTMHLRWTEYGGPPVKTPARRGFGSRLIERALAGVVGGHVSLTYPTEGLVCDFAAAVSGLQADT